MDLKTCYDHHQLVNDMNIWVTRVFAAFGRWTLGHVGPATGWGPSAYMYIQALMLFTQKMRDRRTDRQTGRPD